MVRFTFVVGGGSKVRQKYDPNLQKYMSKSLQDIGFNLDNTACCAVECAETYKTQHDTDKNLKFLHVFPRVIITSGGAGGGGGAAEEAAPALSDLGSPGYLATVCEFATFQKMVQSKTQSWTQRKALMAELQERKAAFDAAEQKMMRMEPLTDEEQELYDLTSGDAIQEKLTWLSAHCKAMVENGEITMGEKQQLREQVGDKLTAAREELAAAEAENKPKKAEKLTQAITNLSARHAMIMEHTYVAWHGMTRHNVACGVVPRPK
mmetsp:Transcript_68405/g.190113  ORF Transcript_68405/g.190113 Transcript_68405/m.190113 type:complete len:264 (-) Transcript_68405:1147-1938(-)